MALIEINLLGERRDKVQIAIARIRAFCPPEGYFVAFSGGKDSVVIKALCDMAGVKYDAHYNVTTVDPPELVRFIRAKYPDVIFDRPEMSMRQLIIKKKFPPTRFNRYCCEYLKEANGTGRIVMTGVRWAESIRRRDNQGLVTIFNGRQANRTAKEVGVQVKATARGGVILANDNDSARLMVERCYVQNKTAINPIIDWTDDEVWEFIRSYRIPYCSLYDEGFRRLGCIGCPMGGHAKQRRDFERWPAYRRMYVQAFEDMLEARRAAGNATTKWVTGEDVMAWWTQDRQKDKPLEGQTQMTVSVPGQNRK